MLDKDSVLIQMPVNVNADNGGCIMKMKQIALGIIFKGFNECSNIICLPFNHIKHCTLDKSSVM